MSTQETNQPRRHHKPLRKNAAGQQAEVEEVERNGRTYLVFPLIAAREMVLDYPEHGTREYLPAQRLEESVEWWAGTPLTFIHPENRDKTADHPTVYVENNIGEAHTPEIVDSEKLRVKAWVDVEKALSIGGLAEEVVQKLRNGEELSVSAGYSTLDDSFQGGMFNGEEYDIEQGILIPDHIAIFPSDEFRARCLPEDGCAAPRLNAVTDSSEQSVEPPASNSVAPTPSQVTTNATERTMLAQEGHRVEWSEDGRPSYGIVVDTIPEGEIYDGVIDDAEPVPGPAALIEVYRQEDDHFVATGRMVAQPLPDIEVISEFPGPARMNTVPLPKRQSYCTAGPCQCGMHDPRVNALSEARTPTYDGLSSADWEPPSFTEYVAEWYSRNDEDPPDRPTVDTAAQDAIEFAASRTLVGDPDTDDADEMVSFPVVNLNDELNENALTAARNLAHNSEAQDSIMSVTRDLLEKHSSGEDTWSSGNTYEFEDSRDNAMTDEISDEHAATLGRRVLNALGIGDGAEHDPASDATDVGSQADANSTEDEVSDSSTDGEEPDGGGAESESSESEGNETPADEDGSDSDADTDSEPEEPGTEEETTEQEEEDTDTESESDADADNETNTTMPDVLSIAEMAAKSAFGVETLEDWDEQQLVALEQTILENNPELREEAESGGSSSSSSEGEGGSNGGSTEGSESESSNAVAEGADTTNTEEETTTNATDEIESLRQELEETKAMVEDAVNAKQNAEKQRKARVVANSIEGMTEEAAQELPEEQLDTLAEKHGNTRTNYGAVPGPADRQPQGPRANGVSDEEVEEFPAGGRSAYEQRKSEGGD